MMAGGRLVRGQLRIGQSQRAQAGQDAVEIDDAGEGGGPPRTRYSVRPSTRSSRMKVFSTPCARSCSRSPEALASVAKAPAWRYSASAAGGGVGGAACCSGGRAGAA